MEVKTDRTLVACRRCGRQYDVTGMAAGTRVRCECAELLTVEVQKARSPRPLKCGRCGGPLQVDATKCAYCDGEITIEERGLSGVCPVCFARLLSGARFCMECGIEIAPQSLRAVAEGTLCPRCKSSLRSRTVGSTALVECTSCGGLWIAQEDLERICEKADVEELVSRALAESPPTHPVDPSSGPTYLPCPTCQDLMVRRNFGGSSGVLIDVCRGHGVWLDHRELERILAFVRRGGLMQARTREVERLAHEAEVAKAQLLAGPAFERDAPGLSEEIDLIGALRWLGRRLAG
jgi:Zn-finger nucleic acid-binding protein